MGFSASEPSSSSSSISGTSSDRQTDRQTDRRTNDVCLRGAHRHTGMQTGGRVAAEKDGAEKRCRREAESVCGKIM